MKLKIALPLISILAACETSPQTPPRTSALCSEIGLIEFHAPVEAERGDWWPDISENLVDTPETVERILKHNAKVDALCPE